MEVTQEMIDKLEGIRKVHLQAQIVSLLMERLEISPEEALELYYSSVIADMIDTNEYNVCCLDAVYLVDELLMQMQRINS